MKMNKFELAMNALKEVISRPFSVRKTAEIKEWADKWNIDIIGGGHNRIVAKLIYDNAPYALKIPTRVGGFVDNAIECYNSKYAEMLTRHNINVGMNLSFSDGGQIDQFNDPATGMPMVLVQEYVTPLHDDIDIDTEIGMKSLEMLLAGYAEYKDLIDTLDKYYYIADVDLRKPFNFGVREAKGYNMLVLLDHGLVLPRKMVNRGNIQPIPLQCPNCGSTDTLHYYINPDTDRILRDKATSMAEKIDAVKKTPPLEKHQCTSCKAFVNSVDVVKQVYENL